MLLAIDAGNTNIVFALYEDDSLRHTWRIKSQSATTADEYEAWLYQLFSRQGLAFSDVKHALISSVFPDCHFHLEKLCAKSFGCTPVFIDHSNVGVDIGLDSPAEIGADRLVNARASIEAYQAPAIVLDFGTATTFDVINEKGYYSGGVIAPGVNLSAEALYQAAAKLPKIDIEPPPSVIGKNTVEAMQAGVYWGYACLIEGLLGKLKAEMTGTPYVIATGGLSSLYAEAISSIDVVDQELTLKGLLYIHNSLNK